MRKETLFVRAVVCLVIFYLIIVTFNYYQRKKRPGHNNRRPYKHGETLEAGIGYNTDSYKSHAPNVYSREMTKKEIRENLGRSTWTLLHTIAAVYPGIPSNEHKKDVLKFINLLSKLYPCGDCAAHFQELLKNLPPRIDNHDDFAGWLCEAHNVVNKRLEKPTFDCKTVDDVWECGCET